MTLLAVVSCTACSSPADKVATPADLSSIVSESVPTNHPAEATAAAVVSSAVAYTNVNLQACLRIAQGELTASESACPRFISSGLSEAISTCKSVGGQLEPAPQPSMQSLDINGDGQPEFLYDFAENYSCAGAPSVFSCGSLGCGVPLFEKRSGTWSTIGALGAMDASTAEVLKPAAGESYGTIRSGCAGSRPCDEWNYYDWNGSAYESNRILFRGHWVDLANDGLWTLVKEMPVLASPSPDALVLERYAAGTEVIVVGTARDTPYKYVSPCNACQSGFMDPNGLRKTL